MAGRCNGAVLLGALVAASTLALAPVRTSGADTDHFQQRIAPLIKQFCARCHAGEKPEGNLRLDSLPLELAEAETRSQWSEVVDRIQSGEMPPEGEPRPSADQIASLVEWLTPRLAAAEAEARAKQGRVVLRRLNRVEYENTLRDLLDISLNLQGKLPPDSSADGFDNAGAAHHTSSFLLEQYLEAADAALSMAICNRPKPPPVVKKRHPLKDAHPIRGTTEKVYRFLDDEGVVCFCSSEWHNVTIPHFYPSEGGTYRFRIAASAIQSPNQVLTFRLTTTGTRLTGKSGLIGYYDAPPGEPAIIEIERYMEPRTSIALLPYGLPNAQTVTKVGAAEWDGRGLAIHYVESEGPLHESWPPESHRRLLGGLQQKNVPAPNARDRVEVVSEQPLVDAERLLTKFASRAYRRKATSDDVAPLARIVQAKLDEGYTFEEAMRAAFKGVLVSPDFLFLRERPGKLDDYALASRLSYFLWSTMPDDKLLDLAAQQRLGEPDVLRGEVQRMLADPKAAAFTENFVGQWLGLREIDVTEPSRQLYPEYDHLLKVSMIREAELFFEEVLQHDLSVANFVAADFAMLNGRLAKHYGIAGVDGWEFRRTELPPDSHRGGVLTMAGVLKVTANGTTTSPVLRGAWVLDRILGTPPAPPPENISAIDPDIRGATTIREQLAKHRSVESCAVCHRRMDPPGFALESFDCIGGWRERYRVTGNGDAVTIDGQKMQYRLGKTVDPSDELESGERFENIDQLKQLLLKDKEQLARALTAKLIAYGTGGAPQAADRAAVDAIVFKAAARDYGLRSLVHEIVQSELFQHK